jgi:hypothetical protein
MATDNQKCVNCEKTGLPILPVRYSVLPKSVKAVMPEGISGARVTDVALDAHHYGLRTLREGWSISSTKSARAASDTGRRTR